MPANWIAITFLEDHPHLAQALQQLFSVSRSQLKKMEKKYPVLKRKVFAKKSYDCPAELVNWERINPDYEGPAIKILAEDDFVLALHKPPGIHGHPLNYLDKKNCLSFLRSQDLVETLQVNPGQHERGLLYRLDQETSGVLVAIKNQADYDYLREHFSQIMTQKIYLAIVGGDFNQEGEHQHWLTSGQKKGSQMRVVGDSQGADRAMLKVQKLAFDSQHQVSLVKVELKTGMRHQIRVQLAYLGHPILGDTLYGGQTSERLFLHAFQYSFSLPGRHKTYTFSAPEAELFRDFFPHLKLTF